MIPYIIETLLLMVEWHERIRVLGEGGIEDSQRIGVNVWNVALSSSGIGFLLFDVFCILYFLLIFRVYIGCMTDFSFQVSRINLSLQANCISIHINHINHIKQQICVISD